jgi:hypothetical protein
MWDSSTMVAGPDARISAMARVAASAGSVKRRLRPGEESCGRLRRGDAHEGDARAVAHRLEPRADAAGQQGFVAGVDIGAQDREGGSCGEAGQRLGAIVEFMVAEGHGLAAPFAHDRKFRRAAMLRVEQRAHELVAGIHRDHGALGGGGLGARGRHAAGQARGPAQAGFVRAARGTGGAHHRFVPAVEIIGVDDADAPGGLRRGRAQRGRRKQGTEQQAAGQDHAGPFGTGCRNPAASRVDCPLPR